MIDVRKVARAVAGAALPLLGLGLGTAASAQGTAYVSSEKDPAITLIDLATLSVKGTIPTCNRGRHIQVTTDRLIMLACSESNAADVIDPATGKSLRRIPLGDEPEALTCRRTARPSTFPTKTRARSASSMRRAASGSSRSRSARSLKV